MVPDLRLNSSLFLDQSHRLSSLPPCLYFFFTFPLSFPSGGNSSLQDASQNFLSSSLHFLTARSQNHPSCALLVLLCCGSPTALCQIICMCVSPTGSSTRGGQKPNGNLCFTSFGTEPFLALRRHSINILESLKCKLIQIGFFLKGSEDQVLRRMNGVQ